MVVALCAFFAFQNLYANNKLITFSADNVAWNQLFMKEVNQHLQSGSLSDTLIVEFKEGVYSLQNTLKFTGKYPSKMNAPIIVKGTGTVLFSGGKTLNAKLFKPLSDPKIKSRIISKEAREKVLELDLKKAGITDLGEIKCIGFGRSAGIAPPQLFYNGNRMTLARYPNGGDPQLLKNRTTVIPIKKITNPGFKKVELPIDESKKTVSAGQGGSFQYSDKRVEKWLEAKDLWVDGIFSRDWSWSLNKVNAIDTVSKTISLTYDEKYDMTSVHSFFFATNLLEEIDVPGEYFIDRQSGKLYFYPPADYNPKTANIALTYTSQELLNLESISNFKVENICFELGRLKAVSLHNCNEVSFKNCEFRNFGISALIIDGQNNSVENCLIHTIGSSAIVLEGGNYETLEKGNNSVVGCEIYDWAFYDRVYSPAIKLSGVGNNVIGNKIHDAPHGAITISGNDQLIEKNEISNVLLEFKDFGAIYGFLGKNQLMRGQIIRGNYFHDIGLIGESVYAIYADEASAGWRIEDNLFYKIGNKGARVAAVLGNTCSYVNVKNNLFLDCSETFELSFHFSTWGKKRYTDFFAKVWKEQYGNEGSIPALYISHYPELKNFMKEERIYVNSNSFTDNTIGNFSIPLKHENYFRTQSSIQNADSLISSKNNIFTEDKSLAVFLENWNKPVDRKKLALTIPEKLINYLYIKE